uniref:Uncharacterized protein AlNc14C383G11239 n=1 Tax=Albugo laibachii Nc14 TaxID=890382 RepID=F0WYH8_9STRA|nr:conserved hypothetical protein [Albugo laibachii Nc14]|eukprot:CCA26533.1 conserved hypothetical protein [Albugo laibachii Nc14]
MTNPLTTSEALHTADFTPATLKRTNQNVFTQSEGAKKRKKCYRMSDFTPNITSRRYFQPTRKLFEDNTENNDRSLSREYCVSNTVSSIAITNDREYLVAGFCSGTIFLYPLQADYAANFPEGILLDQITARGIYTQLMLRVVVSDDDCFIFAGVYRGSTEIRAIKIDSIQIPDISRKQSEIIKECDVEMDAERGPVATSTSYTFSDAKLKGFAAAMSIGTSSSEYRLLCGLGIKNIHIWRFYRNCDNWAWECIFDKQSNGISLELLGFFPGENNTIISKSEHQCIRMWELEPASVHTSGLLTKRVHKDIKNTTDAFALHENLIYCGTDTLSILDLHTGERIEHNLPQVDTAHAADHPKSRRFRRSGTSESTVRHMRTVAQISSWENSPFSVGMCSDGSVFLHNHKNTHLGMATPLQYISGYESFFQDPTLTFQAQFSDLTRMNNANGVLAILPRLSKVNVLSDEWERRQNWLVAAANQSVLRVRTLAACMDEEALNREDRIVSSGSEHFAGSPSQCASSSEEEWDGGVLCKNTFDTNVSGKETDTLLQEYCSTPDTIDKGDVPVEIVHTGVPDDQSRTPLNNRSKHCDLILATNRNKSWKIDSAVPDSTKHDDVLGKNDEEYNNQHEQKRFGRRAVARALLCLEDDIGTEKKRIEQMKAKTIETDELRYQCQPCASSQSIYAKGDTTLLEISRLRKDQSLPPSPLPNDSVRLMEQEVLLSQFVLQWQRHYVCRNTSNDNLSNSVKLEPSISNWGLDRSERFIAQTKQLHGLQLLEAKAHHAMIEYESRQIYHKQHK